MSSSGSAPRRRDPLSRDRIVAASIEILDAAGESELTFRALTARLSTGAGAIYHHIASKDELLAAATDDVVGHILAAIVQDTDPVRAIRDIALAIFDAIDAHPWIGTEVSRGSQPAVLRMWKAIGRQLSRLGLTGPAQSDAGSALVSYVLGSAAQFVAGPRRHPDPEVRRAHLQTLAAQWARDDPDPLVDEMAAHLLDHDDRQQFLAGLEIFLAGVTTGGTHR